MLSIKELKAKIANLDQLQQLIETLPNSNNRTKLQDLLTREELCYKNQLKHAEQKRDTIKAIDFVKSSAENRSDFKSTQDNCQNNDTVNTQVKSTLEENVEEKLSSVLGNKKQVRNVQQFDSLINSTVESEHKSGKNEINLSKKDELVSEEDKLIHEKNETILKKNTELTEMNMLLRKMQIENRELEKMLHNRDEPMVDLTSTGEFPLKVDQLDDKLKKYSYTTAIYQVPLRRQAILPKAREKYSLFNKCIEKDVFPFSSKFDLQDKKSASDENEEGVVHKKPIDIIMELSKVQGTYLTGLKETFDEMLESVNTSAEKEMLEFQFQGNIDKSEEKARDMDNERKEIKVLGKDNSIKLLKAELIRTYSRLEHHLYRRTELMYKLSKIIEQDDLKQTEYRRKQTEMSSVELPERRAAKILHEVPPLIEVAKVKYVELVKSVETLDQQRHTLINNLKLLKADECRQSNCRNQLETSKQEATQCESITEIHCPIKEANEPLEVTIEKRLSQILQKHKHLLAC